MGKNCGDLDHVNREQCPTCLRYLHKYDLLLTFMSLSNSVFRLSCSFRLTDRHKRVHEYSCGDAIAIIIRHPRSNDNIDISRPRVPRQSAVIVWMQS